MGKKAVRVAVDVALTLMIVFEMLIQYTGEFLHEVVGFAFFATVVLHLALAATWMKGTARNAKTGRLTTRRKALAIMGCLLAATMVVLGVSSVAISGILASAGFAWPIGSYAMWADVHAVSAYALCALVVVHLAMHWAFLASAFRVPYDPSRRRAISTGVNAAAALGVVALGVAAANAFPQTPGSATASETDSGGNGADAATSAIEATQQETTNTKPNKKGKGSHGASSANVNAAEADASNGSASSASGNSPSSGSTGTSTASGICTLCRKQCPLSAPKCDKPYEAGLL